MAVSSNRYCRLILTHAAWVLVAVNMVTFLVARFSFDSDTSLFSSLVLSADSPAALLSYMWIHIDLIHFLLNVSLLLGASIMLARHRFPSAMIPVTFITGGIAGGILFIITADAGQSLIGASCGVLALCGATAVRFLTSPSSFSRINRLILAAGVTCVVYLLWSNPSVAPAHIAGFFAGTATGYIGFGISRRNEILLDRRSHLDAINLKIRQSGFSSLTSSEREFIINNINR